MVEEAVFDAVSKTVTIAHRRDQLRSKFFQDCALPMIKFTLLGIRLLKKLKVNKSNVCPLKDVKTEWLESRPRWCLLSMSV